MYILQDCSICFEDYSSERIPHSISCGHVFCRPCLSAIAPSSQNCPHCRAPFGRKTIRKVICTFQDPPAPGPSPPSEGEIIMWEAISSAVKSADDHKQRKLLVRDESRLATKEAGFSQNLLVALDVMRLLVEVESANLGLSQNMETSRALEASLRDLIFSLKTQLDRTNAGPSSQDFQTLSSEIQELKSSIRTVDKTTSNIARQLKSSNPTPAIPNTPRPPSHLAVPNLGQAQCVPQSKPMPLREPSSAEPQSQKAPFAPATPIQLTAPPASTVTQAPTSESSPPSFWSGVQAIFRSSQLEQLASQGLGSLPFSSQPSSKRSPVPRPATAAYAHLAFDFNGLPLRAGEKVEIIDTSDDMRYGHHLVLCRARGEIGYVPRNYLRLGDGSEA